MVKIAKNLPYSVNKKAFWGLLGYKRGKTEISPEVLKRVQEVIDKAKKVIEPVGIYGVFEVKERGEGWIGIGGRIIQSKSLSSHFKGFTHAYLMAVTIGENFDRLMNSLPVEEAVILDAYGSEAVEGAAESLNRAIEREGIHYGFFRFNWRFSPGYGDLSLRVNLLFEEFLRMSQVGIKVTEKYSLLPMKSITAIIPAGG